MTASRFSLISDFRVLPLPDVGLKDPELDVGFMRAGNRYHDFCGKAPHRLKAASKK